MAKTYEALKRSESLPSGMANSSGSVARLASDYEARIRENLRELSMVEGNILGAKKDIKTIYLTSCFAGEGKTMAAVNMAYSLTMNGAKKVLLIDGNPRSPQLHKLFSTPPAPGLADYFSPSQVDIDSVVRPTTHENLYLMTFGKANAKRLSFFAEESHKLRMDQLRERFDYIVFDGNSVMGSSDSAIIANYFDGIVVVIECESTKKEVVRIALEKLRNIGGDVLGVVLNKRKFYIPKAFYGLV